MEKSPKKRIRTDYYRKYKREYREKNKARRLAHYRVSDAIKAGMLIKENCEVCGAEKTEAHHDDYTKPLDVRWLCRKCHHNHHLKLKAA